MSPEKTMSLLSRISSLALAAILAACGGGGPATPPVTSFPEGALRAAQPGDLASDFKARVAKRIARGMTGQIEADVIALSGTVAVATPAAPSGAYAGTVVQEAGVDEDDLIKMGDGRLYSLHMPYYDYALSASQPGRLSVSTIEADGSLSSPASTPLEAALNYQGMYLAGGGRVVVVAQDYGYADVRPGGAGVATTVMPVATPKARLDMYEVLGNGQPARSHTLSLDGYIVSTRMIGNVIYVASTWAPEVSIFGISTGTPEVQKALSGITSASLLPKIRVDGGAAQTLVEEKDCLLQPQDASLSLQLTTVTAIDLSSPALERRSRCFVGDASALYMSPANVYLASSRNYWIANVAALTVMPRAATTDIHKFSLDGLEVDYRGSGEVMGHLGWDRDKAPYRMSEHDGYLRVVSFTGETGWWGEPVIQTTAATGTATSSLKPSPATLTVLREEPAQRALVTVSSLPNSNRPSALGRAGEQVYAVRFAGPLAYVVTFRRVDPLYVLDLSNPLDPRAAGELTVPGFSDYLFPLADGKLLGVGKEATADGLMQGLKVALFDVADPARPAQLQGITLGERGSNSALDFSRHGINILSQGSQVRISLPVRLATTVPGQLLQLQQGLARFTVDTAAGTLMQRSMVSALQGDVNTTGFWTSHALAFDRSVQSTRATYYLTGGRVLTTLE
jgi:hypothetical protein